MIAGRHYQWIIAHDFLPQIIGTAATQDIFNNGRRYCRPEPGPASIPVEFQGAAYRFGHSQVRPSYRANLAGNPDGTAFFGFVFDPAGEGQADPEDLRGGARAQRRFIGWQTFFEFGDGQVRLNTFCGVLELDPNSYLAAQPGWRPPCPARPRAPST
ncbi:peroxidase family protein [Paractinoplanes rishiriensis]|uniref:Uncharacterized protein n=1 Tax=Paractinoplanes rishiriensis TaxID=1050105 RepID=A0A919N0W8_9ACTN|nr:peroxidase family protein [Actinoplanes rishiriensis]GIE95632.1 hypothetical protein Ari01nite_30970 [Actinoplanes rishiriensis]